MIRHHLGYLNVAEAQTFVLGVPAGVETQFMIESAMNRAKTSALPLIRKILGILDTIECQKVGDLELAAVDRLDSIDINQKEQGQLDTQYDHWANALANALGTYRNPFDLRKTNASGGINVRVG